jgi:hypothetical protein
MFNTDNSHAVMTIAACTCDVCCSPDPAKKLGAVLAIDELVLVKVRGGGGASGHWNMLTIVTPVK